MTSEVFNALVFWLPAFLFSGTVHEAAHAWAALRGGDRTACEAGQVSLSPWPHVRRSPLGLVVVPIVSSLVQGWTIGWASAPYDRAWAQAHPRRAALMAAAGPAGNLAIALAAFFLLRVGLAAGAFDVPAQVTLDRLVDPALAHVPLDACAFAARGLSVLLMLNVILLAFNLLPVPPLDGWVVATLALPADTARRVQCIAAFPGLSFAGILVAWRVYPALTRPLLAAVVALLHPGQY